MEKFIPLIKLSKKRKLELAKQKRGSWGEINPVTRKPQNPKAYNRKKAQQRSNDSDAELLCLNSFIKFMNYMLILRICLINIRKLSIL